MSIFSHARIVASRSGAPTFPPPALATIRRSVSVIPSFFRSFDRAPAGGFLSFPSYDLDLPSWDLCIRLLEEPYRTYLIPGSCYGYEGHVRFGFGPGTPLARVEEGMRQIDRFVADYQAETRPLAATA